MIYDAEHIDSPRISYEGGACFVRACEKCGRYVKADPTVFTGDAGLHPGPNATCARCGRTRMIFEGFFEAEVLLARSQRVLLRTYWNRSVRSASSSAASSTSSAEADR
jgi:hypothetical protein